MTIEFKILNYIARKFSDNLPDDLQTMDQYLDFIIPKVISRGEDLVEEEFWLKKRWKEVRDTDDFHEAILHIFNPGGEYLLIVDGNIINGKWSRLGDYNSLMLNISGKNELFDLKYLNGDYFALAKHGEQARKGNKKYFLLVNEQIAYSDGREIDWRNQMERLYNIYREDVGQIVYYVVAILVMSGIIYLLA
jgi:hypothetical protein